MGAAAALWPRRTAGLGWSAQTGPLCCSDSLRLQPLRSVSTTSLYYCGTYG